MQRSTSRIAPPAERENEVEPHSQNDSGAGGAAAVLSFGSGSSPNAGIFPSRNQAE